MTTLTDIEQATGQTFPPLFHELDAAGQLSWGTPHAEWSTVRFPALQPTPPVLLYAQDYEPLERDQLLEAWEDLVAEDRHAPGNEDMQLLPFAGTGAGDHYCFWTNAPGFDAPPVLLVWHDDDRADLLAANFQDFLFRKMVEAVVDYEPGYSLLSEGDLATNLQAWLGTHRAWLRADQVAALDTLFARTDEIAEGDISDDDAEVILRERIGFARMDESIEYAED